MHTGVRTADSGFVFARPDGDPLPPDYFSQAFERLVAKMDLPRIRFHDLRNIHASRRRTVGVVGPISCERMNRAFGRADWLVNGVLVAAYHLHMPWAIPTILSDALVLAYPTSVTRAPESA